MQGETDHPSLMYIDCSEFHISPKPISPLLFRAQVRDNYFPLRETLRKESRKEGALFWKKCICKNRLYVPHSKVPHPKVFILVKTVFNYCHPYVQGYYKT